MKPTARNGWIDVLRALGALAVVLFHFNSVPVPVPSGSLSHFWHKSWMHGYWGVGVFFTLSGFCVFPGWFRSTGCLEFLRRRAIRIFPPYWGSLLLIAGLALTTRLFSGVNDVAALPHEPQTIIATLLLLTDPVTAIPTINWVYWTLSCIVAFYLLSGLVLLCPHARRIPVLVGFHILLCLVGAIWPTSVVGSLFFVKYWPVFGIGLALAVTYEHRPAGRIMFVFSMLHAAWVIAQAADRTHFIAMGVATSAAIFMCRDRVFPAPLRPLARIGEISYSLYLVHVPIGIYALMRFLPVKFTQPFVYVSSQLLLLVVTLAAASLFYLVAERPFLSPRIPAVSQ